MKSILLAPIYLFLIVVVPIFILFGIPALYAEYVAQGDLLLLVVGIGGYWLFIWFLYTLELTKRVIKSYERIVEWMENCDN